MPETLDAPADTADLPSDAELAYRAGVHRAEERAYQSWAAEFDRRVKSLLTTGVDAHQAGQRVMAEMGEFRRQLRDDLADTMLLEEAELLRADGE